MKIVNYIYLTLVIVLLSACSTKQEYAGELPDKVDFNFHVRPILSNNCFTCHGPDSSSREANLRLDIFEGATAENEDGRAAIVPGSPNESLLLERVTSHNPDEQMPPPKMNKVLSEREVALISKWIDQGAKWKKHWAFISPEIPEFSRALQKASPTEKIDHFLNQKAKYHGLENGSEASKNAQIRRLSYLITGLPPSPEKVASFIADSSENAWENLVDEYLNSPQYGERWARHWMDVVRYAESLGHEFDYNVTGAWHYRDYLIRAFNNDIPYDQFVKEHLAGDMLKEPRYNNEEGFNESIIGTAYVYMGEGKHSPVSIKQEEADRIDNMIDVTSKTFQAMTVGCARCHDHKFDPIPTTDYYAMYGMFESARFTPLSTEFTPQIIGNIERIEELKKEIRQYLGKSWSKQIAENQSIAQKARFKPNFKLFLDSMPEIHTIADFRLETESELRKKGWWSKGSFIDDGLKINRESGEVEGVFERKLKLEAWQVGKAGIVRSPNFIIEDEFIEFQAAGKNGAVRLVVDNFQLIQNPIYGDLMKYVDNAEPQFFRMNVSMWKGHKAYFEILPGAFNRHQYAANSEDFIEIDYIFSYAGEEPTKTQRVILPDVNKPEETDLVALRNWVNKKGSPIDARQINQLLKKGKLNNQPENLAQLISEIDTLKKQSFSEEYITGLEEGEAVFSPVFIRGSINQLSEEKVPHQFLFAVSDPDDKFPQRGSGRLAWANRVVDPNNPLSSRVMINRIWHHLFGRGIVETVDNFGLQGKFPTHPELLDYLALQFIEEGWSMKKMIRHILLTDAFRRSTEPLEINQEKDPNNLYLTHFPVKRMEGEAIRDAMLVVSGCMDSTMYGKPIPVHLTKFMSGRGRPPGSGALDGEGRRSVYLSIRRNFLSPWMLTFDMPMPFSTFGKRNVSNVPAQSLTLMNDPFVKEMAENWANRLLAEEGNIHQRITRIYQLAYARNPSNEELEAGIQFLESQSLSYGCSMEVMKDDPILWADYCHTIFNLKEFIHLI